MFVFFPNAVKSGQYVEWMSEAFSRGGAANVRR